MSKEYFSQDEIKAAHSTDLAEYLTAHGEEVKRSGSEKVWYDGKQAVTIRGGLWFHQYEQAGGDAIAFLQRFYNMSFTQAVHDLLGRGPSDAPMPHREHTGVAPVPETPKKFIPYKANINMKRVFAYLCKTRGIDADVVSYFAHQHMIYETEEHHNAAFAGFGPDGKVAHISLRSTSSDVKWRGNQRGSDAAYPFRFIGSGSTLHVFEAPIDMLSYITLHRAGWQQDSYLAVCGVGDKSIMQTLTDNPQLRKVMLSMDNDKAGITAMSRLMETIYDKGYDVDQELSENKDWNEDLQAKKEKAAAPAAEIIKEETEEHKR